MAKSKHWNKEMAQIDICDVCGKRNVLCNAVGSEDGEIIDYVYCYACRRGDR